jgi:hypothetical protein
MPLPLRIRWRDDACEAADYVSLDQQVFATDFWRIVLAPHTAVAARDGARLPEKPNRLRIAHDSFWNFQQVDTDLVPRGAFPPVA